MISTVGYLGQHLHERKYGDLFFDKDVELITAKIDLVISAEQVIYQLEPPAGDGISVGPREFLRDQASRAPIRDLEIVGTPVWDKCVHDLRDAIIFLNSKLWEV